MSGSTCIINTWEFKDKHSVNPKASVTFYWQRSSVVSSPQYQVLHRYNYHVTLPAFCNVFRTKVKFVPESQKRAQTGGWGVQVVTGGLLVLIPALCTKYKRTGHCSCLSCGGGFHRLVNAESNVSQGSGSQPGVSISHEKHGLALVVCESHCIVNNSC